MQDASFQGTVETIITIIAFYYLFKFLARIFFPIILKKAVEKTAENFQRQQQNYQSGNFQQNNTTAGGDIFRDASKSDKPRETKKVGEYVDYEEID